MIGMGLEQFISVFETFFVVFSVVVFLYEMKCTASCLYACASLAGRLSAPLLIIKQ